jgi:hypothetical protein
MGRQFIPILFLAALAAGNLSASPVLCGGPRLSRPEVLESCFPEETHQRQTESKWQEAKALFLRLLRLRQNSALYSRATMK